MIATKRFLVLALVPAVLLMSASNCPRTDGTVKACGEYTAETACKDATTCEWQGDRCRLKVAIGDCAGYDKIADEADRTARCDEDECQWAVNAKACIKIDSCANFNAADCPSARVPGACAVAQAGGGCVANADADKTCKPSNAKCNAFTTSLPNQNNGPKCLAVKSGETELCTWVDGRVVGGTCSAKTFAAGDDPCAPGTRATCVNEDPFKNCELR